ncbi:hypothetical protein [Methylobacterium sp.]|uniref:hypothetical protein n=1 Tax=Methylobacterium sp. TaxID=409 RepID=UPI00258499B9|nr:hypothetical protein [Methylobacterium sp.]
MAERGEVVPEAEIRATLGILLNLPPFARSPKLASFLRFVVDEELAGQGNALKAYTIATQALGRGADFDPALDPSVRVEAGRLRRALEECYAQAGAELGVRIRIPVGAYRPHFERPAPEPAVPEEAPIAPPAEPGLPAPPPARIVIAFSPRGQAAVIALLAGILLMLCIEVGLLLSTRHAEADQRQLINATAQAK